MKKVTKRRTDYETLSEMAHLEGVELRGLMKGKAKTAMHCGESMDYGSLVNAAAGAAAMTYLEKDERLGERKGMRNVAKAASQMLFAEASVSKRTSEEIDVNVSVMAMGGMTVDYGTVKYRVLKK